MLKTSSTINKRILIFLLDQPLDENNVSRFGFKRLKKNNWEIQCWNFINITNPKRNLNQIKYYNKESLNIKIYEFKNYISFFLSAFKLKKKFYYVNFSSDKLGMILIQNIFQIKKGNKVHIPVGTIPELLPSNSRIKKLFYLLTNFKIIKIFNLILNYFSKKFLEPHTNYAFISGTMEMQKIKTNKDTKFFFSHNLDYNIFLNQKSKKIDKKYIVFIDQNLPNHPDWQANEIKSPVTFEKYWRSIEKLLYFINSNYKEKVIISAHPRSKLNDLPLSNFRVIHDRTAELIRDSLFVIGHDSTALQFAALWNKPILFITTDELKLSRNNNIKHFASMFGYKNVVNIDKNLDINFLHNSMKINKKSYLNYIEKFIKKKNTCEVNSWDIVNNNLK